MLFICPPEDRHTDAFLELMTFGYLTNVNVLKICGVLPFIQAVAQLYWYQALSPPGLLQQPQNSAVAETQQEVACLADSKDGQQQLSWALGDREETRRQQAASDLGTLTGAVVQPRVGFSSPGLSPASFSNGSLQKDVAQNPSLDQVNFSHCYP